MLKLNKLLFGTAGVPITSPLPNTLGAIPYVKKLGLECMELEFVRGVKMGAGTARAVGEKAKEQDIVLTAHGPYYINLNSQERPKVIASIKRILDTARVAGAAGGYSITFHAAYYMKMDKSKVYEIVKTHMKNIIRTLKDEGISIWVRPELTGKATQFGDIDELIKLSQDVEMVMPCVDFAHYHARYNGKFNSYNDFSEVLSKIEKGLGREGLNNMHIHMSGINFGEKGEINHLVLKESDMNYKDLMKALKDFKCKGVVISESPNIEADAILMKKFYDMLK
ncbi:MAG: TIM barrel protein [Nanoarchaeota archaeon]|nr:TIM barrel protein [Nanoarchaeota archaeon]MBU1320895.1 TIM barrel protein [Nanoarchaeota archaeon]MBU1597581.1 TIM barrel protein [Nanoarchaeota archaeon]MBU2441504.1 TIM barrel protein [Nanoarchaeota archaeon]